MTSPIKGCFFFYDYRLNSNSDFLVFIGMKCQQITHEGKIISFQSIIGRIFIKYALNESFCFFLCFECFLAYFNHNEIIPIMTPLGH